MPIYFGNKNISEISFGDKSIAEVYYGDKLVFQKDQFTGGLYTIAGSDTEVTLKPGHWVAVTRGGGGAGGDTHNVAPADAVGSQGIGGAGGKGDLTFYPFTLQYLSKVLVHAGEGGLTKANGGNGGRSGTNGTRNADGTDGGASCGGGGGGKPSYIADSYLYGASGKIALNHVLTYANGGGGGGAGGQQGNNGRYTGGSGGGAGGGYYTISSNGIITNHPGQVGPGGYTSGHTGGGKPGVNGYSAILVSAGDGGGGYRETGGAGGTGGGASGGASGAGKRNDGDHRKRASGGGGGGAGGSLDAGGGQAGQGGAFAGGTDGHNYHTTPTDTLADNIKYAGVNDTYGIGGTTSTNGTGGFVLIKKVYTVTLDVTPSDASVTMTTIGFTQSGNTINVMAGQEIEITLKKSGYNTYKFKKTIKRNQTLSITMELIDTLDMGQVSDEAKQTIDCGTITGSVTETINAGDIYEQTIPTA